MAVDVSEQFKQDCRADIGGYKWARITYYDDNNELQTISSEDDLIKFKLKANACANNTFIGNTVQKQLEFTIYNDVRKHNLVNKKVHLSTGNQNGNVEWADFTITEPKETMSNNKLQLTGYDDMHKFEKPFVDNNTYPCMLGDFLNNLCIQVGVRLSSRTLRYLVNKYYVITKNPFSDSVTCLVVLGYIAELAGGFAEINRAGELQISYLEVERANSYTSTTLGFSLGSVLDDTASAQEEVVAEDIPASQYKEDATISDTVFGPINTVVFQDNTVDVPTEDGYSNEASVQTYGEHKIIIKDNPFVNSDSDKRALASGIYNSLRDLTYYPFELPYYGYPFVDLGDRVNIINKDGDIYESYILEYELEYEGAYKGEISASALSETQTKAKSSSETLKQKFRNFGVKLDKQNGKIQIVVEGLDDALAAILLANNAIELKVSKDGIISAINQSPEEVAIMARKIKLEGAISANGNVKITEDGDLEARNGIFSGDILFRDGGKVVGRNGVITNLQFMGYHDYNGTLGLKSFGLMEQRYSGAFSKNGITIQAFIPRGMKITGAYISIVHQPAKWSYYVDDTYSRTEQAWGYARNIGIYKAYLDSRFYGMLDSDVFEETPSTETQIEGIFNGDDTWQPSIPTDESANIESKTTKNFALDIDWKSGLNIFRIESADIVPAWPRR